MKKLALTSLLALFAVSSANAATNYFVGGAAALSFGDDHATLLEVAPEFGWKIDSKWDMGVMAGVDYNRRAVGKDHRIYSAGMFTRYNVAQFGDVNLLLKGEVEGNFIRFNGETASSIEATVVPMITYDVSESVTLYANLNFLGARAGYAWANDKMDVKKGWRFVGAADSDDVMNTSDFQIGFNYNF